MKRAWLPHSFIGGMAYIYNREYIVGVMWLRLPSATDVFTSAALLERKFGLGTRLQ